MDFALSQEQQMIFDMAYAFGQDAIAPLYNETLGVEAVFGIGLALVGVGLVSRQRTGDPRASSKIK